VLSALELESEPSRTIVNHVKRLRADRRVTLRLDHPAGCEDNLRPIIETFSRDTGVEILLRKIPVDDINSTLLIDSVAESDGFDIALPATFGIPDLVSAEAVLDLSTYAARYDPSGEIGTSLYSLGDFVSGKRYGYQTDGDAYLMFYLKSWLTDPKEGEDFQKQTGQRLRPAETWQELDAQIRFFHRPKEGRYGGALFRTPNYIGWEWWLRIHGKGMLPFDEDFNIRINSAEGIAALEELIQVSEYLHPSVSSNGLFENWRVYSRGDVFCNIGWGGTQKFMNGKDSAVKGNLIHHTPPGGRTSTGTFAVPYFNWGWDYVVSARTKEAELAYLFTLFAVSPEPSTRAVREASGFFDPFLSIHYDDPQIQQTYSKEFLSAQRKCLEEAIPDLWIAGQGEYFDVLREQLVGAYQQRFSPKQALDTTAAAWSIITRRLGPERQKEQWKFLLSRYPKALRAILR